MDYYGTAVLASTFSAWFQERYNYAGTFKKPNLVLIGKWMMQNARRVIQYRAIMDLFPNHSMWNVLDEKHIVMAIPCQKRCAPIHSLDMLMQFQ
jgi:hypothetical protein